MIVTAQIGKWLDALDLGRYAEAFTANDIDFRALPYLSDDDLKELGVSLGHRRILLAEIEALEQAEVRPERETLGYGKSPNAERRQLTVMFCDLP